MKRQTEVSVGFPNDDKEPGAAEARKLLKGSGKGEKLTEKLLKYRAEGVKV